MQQGAGASNIFTAKRELEVVTWRDVRENVHQSNPELATIIDQIPSVQQYKLVKATYLYGDLIINEGSLNLPTPENSLLPLNEHGTFLQDLLGYSALPLALNLDRMNEVFISSLNAKKSIPLNVNKPGEFFGTFETLNFLFGMPSRPIWNVSSGIKTIFSLPKISNLVYLDKVRKKHNIQGRLNAKELRDHWSFFKKISCANAKKNPWHNTILFFTKDWLSKRSGPWDNFFYSIFNEAWKQAYGTVKTTSSLTWKEFSAELTQKNLSPSHYLIDNIRHIFFLLDGCFPGIGAIDNDLFAPVQTIKSVVSELAAEYDPIIMGVLPVDTIKTGKPLYYSLSFPTILEGSSLEKKQNATIISNLRTIKYLIDMFSKQLNRSGISGTIFDKAEINYFHTGKDVYNEIRPSTDLVKLDHSLQPHGQDQAFCWTSPFWNGCVSIRKNYS